MWGFPKTLMTTFTQPPRHRLNLTIHAWHRLREVYSDHPVSLVTDWQHRIAGTWLHTLDQLSHGLAKCPIEPAEVVFIIGHWRSGTTLLHELLCLNPKFTYPSTYACMNPQVFPLTEKAVLRQFGGGTIQRPMDRMTLSLASPQEDEFALLNLGASSPYEGLLFPAAFERAMAMADPDDLPISQQQKWIEVFSRFLGRVAVQKPGCPVVLKSPTHSYRVKLLSRLFPNAYFIHIVRHPLEVYASTLNLWKKLFALYSLTGLHDEGALSRQVTANWIAMEEKLDIAIPSLVGERYAHVYYESLVVQPMVEMERIYGQLGLQGFNDALPLMEGYLSSRSKFKKNRFNLTSSEIKIICNDWQPIFEKYNYSRIITTRRD